MDICSVYQKQSVLGGTLQEETMSWDPTMVNHPVDWAARLYISLLFFTLVAAIVRSLRLAWSVSGFSIRQQVSIQNLASNAMDQSRLANAAICNNFDKTTLEHSVENLGVDFNKDQMRTLEQANLRFGYLWQLRINDIDALKRSIYLLLLASAFITFEGFANILRSIAIAKGTGIGALSGGLAEISLLVTLGLGLATAIYLFSLWFEGMLLLRKNRWNYFVGRCRLQCARTTASEDAGSSPKTR